MEREPPQHAEAGRADLIKSVWGQVKKEQKTVHDRGSEDEAVEAAQMDRRTYPMSCLPLSPVAKSVWMQGWTCKTQLRTGDLSQSH